MPRDELRSAEPFRVLRASGDRRLRNELVQQYSWLATRAARRFANRGVPVDDLVQVAQLGLVKAVDRFDVDYGVRFETFATPTVVGELRRFFRDTTWAVKVSRRAQELHLAVSATRDVLAQELGRRATLVEIAARLHVDADAVLEAMEAGAGHRAAALAADEEPEPVTIAVPGIDDDDLGSAVTRIEVRDALSDLPPWERLIVYLRFYEGRTQSEIAERVGVSQVQVSRLLQSSLDRLVHRLSDAAEA